MAGLVLVGATVFLAAGQGEQAMAEVMAKTHGGQGIQFARRREREQVPQADQVQMGLGMLGGRVAEVRRQAFHTTGADVFPAGIRQQHAAAQLLQRLAECSRRAVRTHDQEAAGRRLGDFQQAGQGACRGALQHHGADDHREGQRHQQQRAFVASLIQADRKDR